MTIESINTMLNYDLSAVPRGLTIDKVIRAAKITGYMLYDSKRGRIPVVIDKWYDVKTPKENHEWITTVIMIDVSKEV